MAEKLNMAENEGLPGAPPLFVTAFSPGGEWLEELLESGRDAPEWVSSVEQIRVQGPSGQIKDGSIAGHKRSEIYQACLGLLGAKRAWAPHVLNAAVAAEAVAGLELWTHDEGEASVTEGPVLTLRRPSPGKVGKALFASDGDLSCYAVVRRKDKTAVYVPNGGRFYLDALSFGEDSEPIPRALLDTGLAGAFWGFTQHECPSAAKRAATRLLSVIFEERLPYPVPWIAAAAHAILAHRDLIPEYGDKVIELLTSKDAPAPDAVLLRALLGMAQLSFGKSDKEIVKKDLRAAITALSEHRATFGETVRWLNAKFNVLRDIALRELDDSNMKVEFEAISEWLGKSYSGGQIAAYLGAAPLEGDGWHDALAQKKSTSA